MSICVFQPQDLSTPQLATLAALQAILKLRMDALVDAYPDREHEEAPGDPLSADCKVAQTILALGEQLNKAISDYSYVIDPLDDDCLAEPPDEPYWAQDDNEFPF